MKQILQSLKNGETFISEVPVPSLKKGEVLIKTNCSLISTGTEKMLIDFGKANFINKIKKQPDKFNQVLEKIKLDGPIPTINSIQNKLNKPIPMGYSNVGIVYAVADDVKEFKIGERVVSNGFHSEYIAVSKNLCAKIPDQVSDDAAAFTVIGAIGLQGIRLAKPTFGETFLVSGLGLLGILTGQILVAQGCKVIGIDPDTEKCKLANKFGIETHNLLNDNSALSFIDNFTESIGVDGAIITASTSSSDPIHLAAKSCRKQGRIISIGVTGMEIRRDLFYKKELSFQVSCSYGPGRYDKNYEEEGNDYPLCYVRWTEKRNFEAILEALKKKSLLTENLITHKLPLKKTLEIYQLLSGKSFSLGILILYGKKTSTNRTIKISNNIKIGNKSIINIGLIGAGNYAGSNLIPSLSRTKCNLYKIVSKSGVSSTYLGKRFGFEYSSTDVDNLINDKNCNLIVIATRHDSHGELVYKSLKAGKDVFVEKPLCVNEKELLLIENFYKLESSNQKRKSLPRLMIGFNRRFSPLIQTLNTELIKIKSPKHFIYTINAGSISSEHWTQNKKNGGRLVGEACHFVDLICFLAKSEIIEMKKFESLEDNNKVYSDNFSIQIKFKNESLASIHYFSNGSKKLPKERLEVYSDGTIFVLDNFKKLKSYGKINIKNNLLTSINQDKGQNQCVRSFIDSLLNGTKNPIELEDIFSLHRNLFRI